MKKFSILFLAILAMALCHLIPQVDGSREKDFQKEKKQLDHPSNGAGKDHNKKIVKNYKNVEIKTKTKHKSPTGKKSGKAGHGPAHTKVESKGGNVKNNIHPKLNEDSQKRAHQNGPHPRFEKRNPRGSSQQNGIIQLICNLLKMVGMQNFLFIKDMCAASALMTTRSTDPNAVTTTSIRPTRDVTSAGVSSSTGTFIPSISNPTTSKLMSSTTVTTLSSSTVTSPITNGTGTIVSSGTSTTMIQSSPSSSTLPLMSSSIPSGLSPNTAVTVGSSTALSSSIVTLTSSTTSPIVSSSGTPITAIMSTMTGGLITTITEAPTTNISSSLVSTTTELPTSTPSATDAPTTFTSTTVSSTTQQLPTAIPNATYFSGRDGVQFNLTCSPQVIVIRAAFYGSPTCGPYDVTTLVTNMARDMQMLFINSSSPALNSICPAGGNTLYGWYNCEISTSINFFSEPKQFAIGASHDSTVSLEECPPGYVCSLSAAQLITPDLTCAISDNSNKFDNHPLLGIYNLCNGQESCSLVVKTNDVIGASAVTPNCTTTPYMFLKVVYFCT